MLTIRTAAALLASAQSAAGLAALLRAVGLTGAPQPLSAAHRRTLGVHETAHEAHLLDGPGNLRGLVLVAQAGVTLRGELPQLAARLQSAAPQVLWLVAGCDPADSTTVLAAWSGERNTPRVRALVSSAQHVTDSDADTVCALAAATCGTSAADDMLLHQRWVETLGRDALCRRFYQDLRVCISRLAASAPHTTPAPERAGLALLCASRLLFLAFLEAKGWLDDQRGFLREQFDRCMAGRGSFHARVLQPLFFGTLNTPHQRRAPAALAFGRVPFLNGGLFAPTPLERRYAGLRFSDEALGELLAGVFARYRFTAREETTAWSDAAVDPEMLGHAFESLMGAAERQASGAFFTPHALVARITDQALIHVLESSGMSLSDAERLLGQGVVPPVGPETLRHRLARVTILDPTCGSGAFLVHALQRLAQLHLLLGDTRAPDLVRRDVLTRSLFGVDQNPMAVWLCELRLWLAVVIESPVANPMLVPPLPNLDRNIRVGDTLAGAAFGQEPLVTRSQTLEVLRTRYARATGARKATLSRALDRVERQRALAVLDRTLVGLQHARREYLSACRTPDLFGNRRSLAASIRVELVALRAQVSALRRELRRLSDGGALPFSFPVHFANVADAGGFDAIVGNPPWVRVHRIPPAQRVALRQRYAVYRNARWAAGAEGARAGAGFSAQVDLAALFAERTVELLRPGAVAVLLLPAKLWTSLAGGGLRQLLAERTSLFLLEDRSLAGPDFDAAVYPSILGVRRHPRGGTTAGDHAEALVGLQRKQTLITWPQPQDALPLDQSPGSPWVLAPPRVRRAFNRLADAGVPLAASPFGPPLLGVKCGCNDAYLVRVLNTHGNIARVQSATGHTGTVERTMLRPVLRGEATQPWHAAPAGEFIIWPYDAAGQLQHPLPPHARRWFGHFRRRLEQRADARSARHWWTLFRVEGAQHDLPRVVWADFGRTPRALVLPAGNPTVPLNTCYVTRCAHARDADALAVLLNSPVAAAWLHLIAEPARGGYHRYLGWTMARFPLPADWPRAVRLLAPLAPCARASDKSYAPPCVLSTDAVMEAYQLPRGHLDDLLTWAAV